MLDSMFLKRRTGASGPRRHLHNELARFFGPARPLCGVFLKKAKAAIPRRHAGQKLAIRQSGLARFTGSPSVLRVFLKSVGVLALVMMTAQPQSRILVHGHRGARAMRPENTIPAFQYAIGVGVDFLEMDVAVTKDNVLVISHDPEINPVICKGPKPTAVFHELTLAELREWDCGALKNPRFPKQQPVPGTRIPTLDEVLTLGVGNNVQFNIETKSFPDKPQYTPPPDVFAKMMLDVIRRHHMEPRSIVQSFDFRTLHAMKKLAPKIRLAALWEAEARDFVGIAHDAGAGIISPQFELVTAEQVKRSHAAGLEVVPWTADTPQDWDRLIAAGVDAIITDDPAALIDHLKAKGLR